MTGKIGDNTILSILQKLGVEYGVATFGFLKREEHCLFLKYGVDLTCGGLLNSTGVVLQDTEEKRSFLVEDAIGYMKDNGYTAQLAKNMSNNNGLLLSEPKASGLGRQKKGDRFYIDLRDLAEITLFFPSVSVAFCSVDGDVSPYAFMCGKIDPGTLTLVATYGIHLGELSAKSN